MPGWGDSCDSRPRYATIWVHIGFAPLPSSSFSSHILLQQQLAQCSWVGSVLAHLTHGLPVGYHLPGPSSSSSLLWPFPPSLWAVLFDDVLASDPPATYLDVVSSEVHELCVLGITSRGDTFGYVIRMLLPGLLSGHLRISRASRISRPGLTSKLYFGRRPAEWRHSSTCSPIRPP